MFLTNLTAIESGQVHLLDKDGAKGTLLENMMGMFMFFKTNTTFDFVSNIFANISSLKAGRQWIVESGQIKPIILALGFPDLND